MFVKQKFNISNSFYFKGWCSRFGEDICSLSPFFDFLKNGEQKKENEEGKIFRHLVRQYQMPNDGPSGFGGGSRTTVRLHKRIRGRPFCLGHRRRRRFPLRPQDVRKDRRLQA